LVFRPSSSLAGTTDHSQDRVVYYLSNGIIYKSEYPFGGSSKTYQITTQDVTVNNLAFYVKGTKNSLDSPTDYNQPVVTIVIAGVTIPLKKASSRSNLRLKQLRVRQND
jgi:hypothetical protein